MRRLEIENGALKTEIEELKAERDALRARVAELERESEAAKTGGGAPVEKRKRGRPKGSKNKPKVR
jgi:cell division protein FtsB